MEKTFKLKLTHDQDKYTQYAKHSAKVVYWIALLMMAVGNFLIFLALIPLMLIISANQLVLIVGSTGLLFGVILSNLVRGIEHLEPKHHIFAAIFIPVLSIINISILISIYDFLNDIYTVSTTNILYASCIYVVMFALPYMGSFIIKKIK